MATFQRIHFSVFVMCLLLQVNSFAQNLSFSAPAPFFAGARSDKSPTLLFFKESYFLAWKAAGNGAPLYVLYAGKHYDTTTSGKQAQIAAGRSSYAPVLQAFGNRFYLLWIDVDGQLRYLINDTDTSFNLQESYTLRTTDNIRFDAGISAAVVNDQLVIASHASGRKDRMASLSAVAGADGKLTAGSTEEVSNGRSADHPSVVALPGGAVRFSWHDYKKQDLYYTEYEVSSHRQGNTVPIADARSGAVPSVYSVLAAKQLFYIWKGAGKDNRLYYSTTSEQDAIPVKNTLPDYFSSSSAVAVCEVDDNNFLMAYVGENQQIYLSHFSSYRASSWMGDLLSPHKSHYTLQDIVLPGSHDAGMSVLTAAGGMQRGTINECNTLTQTQPIGRQLHAGIRLFDLRVGTYEGEFYTKHCASDCMSDAIGGGYGERLKDILTATRDFLRQHQQEIVLFTFSHFCERETPVRALGDYIVSVLGKELVFVSGGRALHTVPLQALAGKVLVTFEHYADAGQGIDSCSTLPGSGAFINFNREYAATNNINLMMQRQEAFFRQLNVRKNDLVRLDWQLTQSSDEAAMVCNNFQSEDINPVINSVLFLTSAIKKHQSIIDLSLHGNKYLPSAVNKWIGQRVITAANKPNVLYVDVAGSWITDYCIDLNQTALYSQTH